MQAPKPAGTGRRAARAAAVCGNAPGGGGAFSSHGNEKGMYALVCAALNESGIRAFHEIATFTQKNDSIQPVRWDQAANALSQLAASPALSIFFDQHAIGGARYEMLCQCNRVGKGVLRKIAQPVARAFHVERTAHKSNLPDFRMRTDWICELQAFLAEDAGIPLGLF